MHVRRDPAPILMTYAIVKLGGKQYRVQEGEQLLVDRLAVDESKTFHPEVLLVGGDGKAELSPKGVEVTARIVGHELGDKIVIGQRMSITLSCDHRVIDGALGAKLLQAIVAILEKPISLAF